MLNRQGWDESGFHRMLAALVEATPGDHVLDFGCGRGASLGALLDAVGEHGRVVGLDQIGPALVEAEGRYAADILSGRLVLVHCGLFDSRFPDNAFDAVLCQNVIECVNTRDALVAEAHRILKPGGRLILGHHDFDGIIIASADRDLTRRLIHRFADTKQRWQEASEGRMGRMIPGLVAKAGFASIEIETKLFVDLTLDEGSYARTFIAGLIELSARMGFGREEVMLWSAGLEAAAAEGRFFFGLPWVGAICRKAGR
jgi:ubiquinone/menaquinone biosynthesis C-methylase UbiE